MPKHARTLLGSALVLALVTVVVCSAGRAVEAYRHPDAELPGLEWLPVAGSGLTLAAGLAASACLLWLAERLNKC